MKKFSVVYWKEADFWIGYIQNYPDFRTQGKTLEELKENLIDIYKDISNGEIENIRKAEIMELSI
jgi:predicted RNase H-like HicB family nuclease